VASWHAPKGLHSAQTAIRVLVHVVHVVHGCPRLSRRWNHDSASSSHKCFSRTHGAAISTSSGSTSVNLAGVRSPPRALLCPPPSPSISPNIACALQTASVCAGWRAETDSLRMRANVPCVLRSDAMYVCVCGVWTDAKESRPLKEGCFATERKKGVHFGLRACICDDFMCGGSTTSALPRGASQTECNPLHVAGVDGATCRLCRFCLEYLYRRVEELLGVARPHCGGVRDFAQYRRTSLTWR